jgi:hypothetical protein
LYAKTHNDEPHGYPHSKSTAGTLTEEERKNAASKTTQVVNADNDPFQPGIGISKLVAEVLITNDTTKDSLIVSARQRNFIAKCGETHPNKMKASWQPIVIATCRERPRPNKLK